MAFTSGSSFSFGEASNGQCHVTISAIPQQGSYNDTYDIERCAREGFLFYQNEDTREEEKRRKSVVVGNGTGGVIVNANVPLMALNTTKAGMEGLDVETINKTIMDASEGSKFYEHKRKAQEKIDRKIIEIKYQLEKLTQDQIEKAQMEVDRLVAEVEENMDLSHYYVHIDMDAFFASVEMRDDPSLKDVPMAVGSESMLSTSNYAARRFGVRAAMPGFIARKLCPYVKIIPCNFKKYEEASRMVEVTIKEYDQNLFMCMDEADLDITKQVVAESIHENMRHSSAWRIVQEMRRKIEMATKLTASAGIAPTRFLAKLCSDIKKPNGQCALRNNKQAIKAFLSAIPIRKVCGIGNVTEQMLKAVDIHNCKDLWEKRAILSLLFKRATFQNLLGIAMGTGSTVFRDITTDSSGRKSLSCERTFIGTADLNFLENLCKSLCSEVEKDLIAAGLCCKTITLKIKTTEYDVKTRARSIMERTDMAGKIFEAAWKIFMSYVREIPDLTIRLMGVRVSNLEEKDAANTQQTLHQYLQGTPFPSNNTTTTNTTTTDDTFRQNNETNYCSISCPVCGQQIQASTVPDAERLMDIHIDECLSKTKVKEVRSENISSSTPPKKRKTNSKVANEPKKPKRASTGLPINAFFQKL